MPARTRARAQKSDGRAPDGAQKPTPARRARAPPLPTIDDVWPADGRASRPEPEVWATLTSEILHCRLCHLSETRTQAVPYRGGTRPKVWFVGEAPGAAEDKAGLPFVGSAGRVLDRAIAELGLSEAEFGVSNVIKCRPPDNRWDREGARACRPYLARQAAWLRPWVVVTLGTRALEAFDPAALPISKSAGTVRVWRERPLFPMLHPAATLRAPPYKERWHKDVATLAARLREWLAGPRPPSLT